MGWGGSRTGSGRKPNGTRPIRPDRRPKRDLVPIQGGKFEPEDPVSAIPPENLPLEQRDFWHRNASKAIAQGTLTPQTVEAFWMLCELDAERRATKATIDKEGRTYLKVTVDGSGQEHEELKAHPMVSRYDRLSKQVENLLARFKLAPFGKAEVSVRPRPAANPWASVSGR